MANRNTAAPYLDRFESKVEQYRKRREAIRSKRVESQLIQTNRIDELDTFWE